MTEVIRGTINGKEKYCRIPIQSRLAETMMLDETTELSAEKILSMPHDKAAAVIDAIMQDWLYWLKRAGELWVLARATERRETDGRHTRDADDMQHEAEQNGQAAR